MKKIIMTFLLVLLSASVAQSGDMYTGGKSPDCPQFAQLEDPPPPYDGRRHGEGPFRKGMDEEDMKRWETLQMMKVLELLDLKEDQENKFIVIFRKHKKEQREYMLKRDSLIETMATALRQDNKSEKDILKTIEELNRLDSKGFEHMQGLFDEAKSILTVEQLAKLYVFQARFGSEVFNKLKEFRRHGMGQPGNFGKDSLREGR